MKPTCLLIAVALVSVPLADAAGQEPAEGEFRRLFERQLETFRNVRESSSLGQTRGLVLAPVEEPEVEAVVVEPVPRAGELDLSDSQTVPVAAPASVQHWVLPDDQQVNMRVNFAFDSAVIEESERPKLRQICSAIEDARVNLFRIVGHTDATGDAAYNQRLSIRRAEEVKRFFTDDCGISAERLEAIGVGKQFPLNKADPYAGENRRVEFQAMS